MSAAPTPDVPLVSESRTVDLPCRTGEQWPVAIRDTCARWPSCAAGSVRRSTSWGAFQVYNGSCRVGAWLAPSSSNDQHEWGETVGHNEERELVPLKSDFDVVWHGYRRSQVKFY